jgi:putative salt-induced outer membrane protein
MHRTLAVLSALSVFSVLPLAAQDKPKEKPVKVVADLGYVTASGNSEFSTLNLGEKLTWKPEGSKLSMDQSAKYVYGKTDGEESANQLGATARVNYAISDRVAAFGGVEFDRDPFGGIDKRFSEPIGLSWLALDAAKNKITLEGGANGVQVTYTELQDGGEFDQQYFSARVAATYKWLFSEKGYFQLFGEYLPALEEGIGYRANTEAAVIAPIAGIVALKVSYLMRYNSQPPTGFEKTDRTFTTGIQITP